MTTSRWLLTLGSLLAVLVLAATGGLAVYQADQRTEALTAALDQQRLKVAPVIENARIYAGLVFDEMQAALVSPAPPPSGGLEELRRGPAHYELVYSRSPAFSPPSGILVGNLVALGDPAADPSFGRYRHLLQSLYERDLNSLGHWWTAQVDRTSFLSKDRDHLLSVPRWNLEATLAVTGLPGPAEALANRAAQLIGPYPAGRRGAARPTYYTEAWVDPVDGKPRQTLVSPLYDPSGQWLGNAVVDFDLTDLDALLAASSVGSAQWVLVTKAGGVLARHVSPRGDFAALDWGQTLSRSPLPLPEPLDGTLTTAGAYTVRVAAVPGSQLLLYGLVPTSWILQDLPFSLTAGAGLLVLVIAAFLLLGWAQRRGDVRSRRQAAAAEAQVAEDRERRDAEAAVKAELVDVGARLQQAATVEAFAAEGVRAATTWTRAGYGAFYRASEREGLVPVGTSGLRQDSLTVVPWGEGLLGEAAKTQASLTLEGDQTEAFRLVWGQGPLTPVQVDLLPVVQGGRTLGVLVLGFLERPAKPHRAYYEALLPAVSLGLEILVRNQAAAGQAQALERQQAVLQETQAWNRSIIEASPGALIVVDENGLILMTNRQAELLFGYGAGALGGLNIDLLVPPAVRPRHSHLRQSFASRDAESAQMGQGLRDLRAVRRDGTEFGVTIGLTKLPALQGNARCVCAWVSPRDGA